MFAINNTSTDPLSQYYNVVAGPMNGGSGTVLGMGSQDPVDTYTPSQG